MESSSFELWQLIVTSLITLLTAGPISAIIALRYAKRNAAANTRKNEAEADNSEATTESTIVANAKEIIQLYQDGVRNLTELHERQSEELNKRCQKLEEEWAEDKRQLMEQIEALKKSNAELRTQIAVYAANSDKQDLIEENARLKVENKELRDDLHKVKTEFTKYKKDHPANGKDKVHD